MVARKPAEDILADVMVRMGLGKPRNPAPRVKVKAKRRFPGYRAGSREDMLWNAMDDLGKQQFREYLSMGKEWTRARSLEQAWNQFARREDKAGRDTVEKTWAKIHAAGE